MPKEVDWDLLSYRSVRDVEPTVHRCDTVWYSQKMCIRPFDDIRIAKQSHLT